MNADDILNDVLKNSRGVKLAKPQTQYVRAGKGRKECPQCHVFVGVRTLTCVCGHNFVIGQSKKDTSRPVEEPVSDEDRRYAIAAGLDSGGVMVYAGSGPCPAKLVTTDYNGVVQFCNDIVHSGLPQRKLYMPSAIKCWLRNIIPPDDEDYSHVCKLIDKWYDDKVASTMEMEV
jgi:hypothetical protein